MTEKTLTHCYVFANGMVMAFDQNGEQMPDYQGRLEEVEGKIKEDYPKIEIAAAHWRP